MEIKHIVKLAKQGFTEQEIGKIISILEDAPKKRRRIKTRQKNGRSYVITEMIRDSKHPLPVTEIVRRVGDLGHGGNLNDVSSTVFSIFKKHNWIHRAKLQGEKGKKVWHYFNKDMGR